MPQNYTVSRILAVAAAAGLVLVATPTSAQRVQGQQDQEQTKGDSQSGRPPPIDTATAKALNTAIEALNMEKYAEAQAAIGTLNLEKLSPYERSKVEQILFKSHITRKNTTRLGSTCKGPSTQAASTSRRSPRRAISSHSSI